MIGLLKKFSTTAVHDVKKWIASRQPALLTAAIAYTVSALALLHASGSFMIPCAVLYTLPLALVVGWSWWISRGTDTGELNHLDPLLGILACGALAHLVSSATQDPFFFLLDWIIPNGRLWDSLLVRWVAGSIIFAMVLWKWPRIGRVCGAGIAILTIVASTTNFATETGLDALYRDDHPSFLFRIWIFSESFPQLIYYNPLWNGGKIATYIVASGTTGPAVLLWPFLFFWPIEQVYTVGVLLLFVWVLPLLAYLSLRIVGGTWIAGSLAAAFAAGTSWGFFRWLFDFGTVGACFSGGFLLPVACLIYRLLYMDSFSLRHAILLIVCSVFFLIWPGNWVIALALVPPLLLSISALNRRRIKWLVSCGIPILVLIVPLIISTLNRVDVSTFASKGADATITTEENPVRLGTRVLGGHLRELHPALLWLGILLVPWTNTLGRRRFIIPLLVPLLLMAGWGSFMPGGLALSRAMIPLGFLVIWPASLACDYILARPSGLPRILAAPLLALLAVSGYATTKFYANESQAAYRTMPDDVKELIHWIGENTPENSRILFAGSTVHAYGGGHVAALPYFTRREMMAADYYHFSPTRVEYFYPPREFRTTDEDVFRFMKLYNVSHIVAYHEPSTLRFYRKYPQYYEEVHVIPGLLPKTIFRVRQPAYTMFLKNEGRVDASVNRFDVVLQHGKKDAVIKYNYSPELTVSPPAELFPYHVEERTLIGIHPNGATNVIIRFSNLL